MLGRTHVSIGLAALTYAMPSLVVLPGFSDGKGWVAFSATVIASAIGSLTPDLDQPGSTLSRDIAGPFGSSRVMALVGGAGAIYLNSLFHIHHLLTLAGIILLVMAFIKHRGITHSLLGIGVAWYAVTALQGYELYRQYVGVPIVLPFMIGYVSHIIADFFAGGIALLYPVLKLNMKMPLLTIHTGSLIDRLVINYAAFALAVIHVLSVSHLKLPALL